jgi:hypothetical protein
MGKGVVVVGTTVAGSVVGSLIWGRPIFAKEIIRRLAREYVVYMYLRLVCDT